MNESLTEWEKSEKVRKRNARIVSMLDVMSRAYDELYIREVSSEEMFGASELFIEFVKKLVESEDD